MKRDPIREAVVGYRRNSTLSESNEFKPSGMFPGVAELFPLGRVVSTPGVLDLIPRASILNALKRHVTGDWGDLSSSDKRANDEALKSGDRLLSSYNHGGQKFWIITERDRSATTILLPDEY